MNEIHAAIFFEKFIDAINATINQYQPISWRTAYILLTLNIAWLGILTALGKYEFGDLIEKFLIMGITMFAVRNLAYISTTFLNSLLALSERAMDPGKTSVILNPPMIFEYANSQLLDPINNAMTVLLNEEPAPASAAAAVVGYLGLPTFSMRTMGLILFYGLFLLAVYVCFAVIVVQIMVCYISYMITLLFGQMLLPFTLFKPLEFIGKNVFSSILGQALSLGVTVFIADLGLRVFGETITDSAINALVNDGKLSLSSMWTILAGVLLYFYLCLKAPTLVTAIITGSPALGAGGLVSTIAAAGAAVTGMLPSFSGGGQASSAQAPAQGAAGPGASQFMPSPDQRGGAQNAAGANATSVDAAAGASPPPSPGASQFMPRDA